MSNIAANILKACKNESIATRTHDVGLGTFIAHTTHTLTTHSHCQPHTTQKKMYSSARRQVNSKTLLYREVRRGWGEDKPIHNIEEHNPMSIS